MSRGIFDTVPSRNAGRQESPFTVVHEPAPQQASPFSVAPPAQQQEAPFRVVETNPAPQASPFAAAQPAPPFHAAEPAEGFGFEAPAFEAGPFSQAPAHIPAQPASPFSVAPVARQAIPQPEQPVFQTEPAPSPFAPAVTPQAFAPQSPASPFSPASESVVSPQTRAAISAFERWQEPAPPQPAAQVAPQAQVFSQPAAPAPQPAPVFEQPAPQAQPASDSYAIRQIELRAIFGVDREMTADEILQRARALPGMKNIARVGPQDAATIEAVKTLLPNLGFGNGTLKLYAGPVPLEFIREGNVLLAVQTDGGFAPGVKETLMLVARELNRMG